MVFRLDLNELGDDPQALVRASSPSSTNSEAFLGLLDSSLGSIARYAVWPHATIDGKAVLAARILAAVPRRQADQLLAARRRLRQANDEIRAARATPEEPVEQDLAPALPSVEGMDLPEPSTEDLLIQQMEEKESLRAARARPGHLPTPVAGSYESMGLDRSVIGLINSGSYRVRPTPVSMARAVGHVFHYPADLLTADPDAAAAVLGRLAGRRRSSVRGVFRTSLSVNPRYYPLQFVPTNPKGAGVAVRILSRQPDAEEGPLARDFAGMLGIEPVDTFEQAARAVGMPLYWLGRIDYTIAELVRPKKRSALYQAGAGRRPKRPGLRHALVYLHAGLGLMVLSTWPPVNWDAWPASDQSVVVSGGRLRGRAYTLQEAGHFARRLSAALAAGERQDGDGGGRDDHPQDAQALPSGTKETRVHGPE